MSLPRVLLAEDDSFLALLVRQTLEDAGHRIFVARNGEEAVSMADYEMPDMVILDVNMPRLNGIEALRQIRKQSAHATTPAMMLTAARDEVSVRAAIQAGATDFLAKPFQPDILLKRVQFHLNRDLAPSAPSYLQI